MGLALSLSPGAVQQATCALALEEVWRQGARHSSLGPVKGMGVGGS